MILISMVKFSRSCGPTDKASDYESGDSRFESWQDRAFICELTKIICVKFDFYTTALTLYDIGPVA